MVLTIAMLLMGAYVHEYLVLWKVSRVTTPGRIRREGEGESWWHNAKEKPISTGEFKQIRERDLVVPTVTFGLVRCRIQNVARVRATASGSDAGMVCRLEAVQPHPPRS